ncbi:MAG: zinc ribbon domain-containing protein [Thermoplasmata archaeon]|nr:zinc ribbon domain-containing protein [Thermoplasmata archaeon]
MTDGTCPSCGDPVPAGYRYCGQCGTRCFPTNENVPLGPRYWGFRFQVDPSVPPPRRDVRYVLIVVGFALTILAVLLFVVSAIVSDAISAGAAACTHPPCTPVDPGSWFAWIALPFLSLGIALLAVGLWWGLRTPTPAR